MWSWKSILLYFAVLRRLMVTSKHLLPPYRDWRSSLPRKFLSSKILTRRQDQKTNIFSAYCTQPRVLGLIYIIEGGEASDDFFFKKKSAIDYTGCGGRPWYLQHRYLNSKKRRKRKEKRKRKKEKGKRKKILEASTQSDTNICEWLYISYLLEASTKYYCQPRFYNIQVQ